MKITPPTLSARLRLCAEQLAADITAGTYVALDNDEVFSLSELSCALAEFAEAAAVLEEANRPLTHRERAARLFGTRPQPAQPADIVWLVGGI